MKGNKTVFSMSSAAAAIMLSLSGVSLPLQTAQAWWTCSSGYEFHVKSSNPTYVQCTKWAASTCPTGYERIEDGGPGSWDICRIPGTRIKEKPQCKSGYTLMPIGQGKADKCKTSKAPSRNV